MRGVNKTSKQSTEQNMKWILTMNMIKNSKLIISSSIALIVYFLTNKLLS
jgi:hypothetical protein